jgi:hypothetical protein
LSVGLLVVGVHASFAQTADPQPSQTPGAGPQTVGWQLYGSRSANTFGSDTLEDRNGSTLVGNPWLDGPRNNLGWFASVDVDAMASHINNHLNGNAPNGDQVALPSANLSWTAAPRFELGYRFGQGLGEFIVAYRFVSTNGSGTIANFDAAGNPAALQSRFSMQVIDLDYAAQENSLLPNWDMKWRVGCRLAGLFFDSNAVSPLLQQRETNDFFGAGPHASLELWRPIVESRLGFYTRLDFAEVMGNVVQTFEESVGGPAPSSGITRQTQIMPTTMMNVQAGLTWTPNDSWRLSAGYTYEHWWDATYDGNSRGDVWTQGIMFRAEWKY